MKENDNLTEFATLFILCKQQKPRLEKILAEKAVNFSLLAMFDIIDKYQKPNFENDIELFANRYRISKRSVIETYFMGYILKYTLLNAKIDFNNTNFTKQ